MRGGENRTGKRKKEKKMKEKKKKKKKKRKEEEKKSKKKKEEEEILAGYEPGSQLGIEIDLKRGISETLEIAKS
ncbi:hypothetical protein M8J75_011932 [Diaphorina citri]|nr:hypothetical protein M8J75_011932 [Diaphorina citri]KAI5728277.1 hypothetical protein M8J77_014100 [Diaphorina citri]